MLAQCTYSLKMIFKYKIYNIFSQQSNSSSKSDIVIGEKSKKKGLFGKLKKLTKSSKSFDNDNDLVSNLFILIN